MTSYYNEIDPYAAQWLRNLIDAGHIAPGVVDQRSIEDVRPSDLGGFTQCHFFAGIGVWSLALRRSGWSDDRPVWTGSCPCQPFSAAGKGGGFSDERHLWPAFYHLIEQCRPAVILGEQVASSDSGPWIDLVHTDMETLGYAFGAVPFPSAGVGAPHIRDRLYWVAHADLQRQKPTGDAARTRDAGGTEQAGVPGDTERTRLAFGERLGSIPGGASGADAGQAVERAGVHAGGLADTRYHDDAGKKQAACNGKSQADGPADQSSGHGISLGTGAGPINGFWRHADWLGCRDAKFRPVEPGTFPLAHGATSRVGRLRAYGNAINAEAARVFIKALM